MKKALLALAIIVANFTSSGQAIIPFVGGNLSGYQLKQDNWSSSGVPGLNLGAVADIRLSHLFYLQPGLEYAMTGGRTTYTYPGLAAPPAKFQYRVHSLQVPVMMMIKTSGEHECFFAGAGFYVSTNLGGQLHSQKTMVDPFGHTSLADYKENLLFDGAALNSIQRFDFGLNLGIGYHMTVGPELYLFYQKGTVDMLSHLYYNKSNSYQLGIAARYALKWSPKHIHSNKYVNHK